MKWGEAGRVAAQPGPCSPAHGPGPAVNRALRPSLAAPLPRLDRAPARHPHAEPARALSVP